LQRESTPTIPAQSSADNAARIGLQLAPSACNKGKPTVTPTATQTVTPTVTQTQSTPTMTPTAAQTTTPTPTVTPTITTSTAVTATVTVTPTVTATQPPGQMADLVRYTYDSSGQPGEERRGRRDHVLLRALPFFAVQALIVAELPFRRTSVS
jgi:hypothetical protein